MGALQGRGVRAVESGVLTPLPCPNSPVVGPPGLGTLPRLSLVSLGALRSLWLPPLEALTLLGGGMCSPSKGEGGLRGETGTLEWAGWERVFLPRAELVLETPRTSRTLHSRRHLLGIQMAQESGRHPWREEPRPGLHTSGDGEFSAFQSSPFHAGSCQASCPDSAPLAPLPARPSPALTPPARV